jgi:cellulose synthase/poly-beta-1,6-N-acetylglucosamine synthase-like glycosyltransferase
MIRDNRDRAEARLRDDQPQRSWERLLFGAGLLLSSGLLLLLTYRIAFRQSADNYGLPSSDVYTLGVVGLSAVALLSGSRWFTLWLLAFLSRCRQRSGADVAERSWPFVSIFVPSYNESETIEAALQSLITLDYPAYEVIVVNDGSTDDTLERARRFARTHGACSVRVYDKPNGGKWSAHNLAFQRSSGELILCIDADSRLDPAALRTLAARMEDPRIGGIAGQMRVRNRDRLIGRLQGLEYLMANGAVRTAQGLFGTVLIVPGPIGMFRRSVMEEVWLRYTHAERACEPGAVAGPFEGDTFAEDFDLSLAILSLGERIVYEPRAISYTRAPESIPALLNQRYRWLRGAMQVLKKFWRRQREGHRLCSPRLWLWLTVTCGLDLTIFPLVYFLGLVFLLLLLAVGGNLPLVLGMFAVILLLHLCAGAFFISTHNDQFALLQVLPVYGLYTGLFLGSAWVVSVWDELRGTAMRW